MPAEITRLTDPYTGDVCIRMQHDSGLEIRVMEMPGFSTAYAEFGVRFGAMHRQFRNGDTVMTLPAGTAHYMEHKLFEKADGDVSGKFSALGAADNAFTDYDRTVYHFHTQRNFGEALALLLEFVQTPYFTQESVDRERSIIAQELSEALDDPADQVICGLLEGMYRDFPLHPHILGTTDSLNEITPELLHLAHSMFYHPENMVLCCAGNVQAEQVLAIADRMIVPRNNPRAVAGFPLEPPLPAKKRVSRHMAVGKTMFAIGFKSPPASGMERLRNSLLTSLTADLLIGPASPLYQKLLADGLINDTFSTDCFAGEGWFSALAEGESDEPEAVLDALLSEIRRMEQNGADASLFEILKRSAYGDTVMSMNHPETACAAMLDSFIWDRISPFARTEVLAQLTPDDVCSCLRERFRQDSICLSVIEPNPPRKSKQKR